MMTPLRLLLLWASMFVFVWGIMVHPVPTFILIILILGYLGIKSIEWNS